MKDQEIYRNSKKVWEDSRKLFSHKRLNFPNENLVRIFSGKYVPVTKPPASVMDHGFGHGNNLVYFANRGYEVSGCEISENLIDETKKLFDSMNTPIDLRLIKGLEIPFKDESFDIVVSWSAIYFNGYREAVLNVVNELRRVLKKGGILFLATVNSDSAILSRCSALGNGSYRVVEDSEDDNLKGLIYYVPQSEDELVSLFDDFSSVRKGGYSFNLCNPKKRVAYDIIYAIK